MELCRKRFIAINTTSKAVVSPKNKTNIFIIIESTSYVKVLFRIVNYLTINYCYN